MSMKVKVKVTQLCPTLQPHGLYTVHGILQARILEWVAIPDLGIKSRSAVLQADSSPSEPPVCVAHLFMPLLPTDLKQQYRDFCTFFVSIYLSLLTLMPTKPSKNIC